MPFEEKKVESFDCGDSDLNDFILNESPLYRQTLLAVSYIVAHKLNNYAASAYFSLANDFIPIRDFENKTDFNRFRKRRFVNEKRLKSYPAVKICRLRVHLQEKGIRTVWLRGGILLALSDRKTMRNERCIS